MTTYVVSYAQTAEERYDTDVNERAQEALKTLGLTVVGTFGGCGLGPYGEDPLPADNGFDVEATPEQVALIPDALRFIIGHPETLRVEES